MARPVIKNLQRIHKNVAKKTRNVYSLINHCLFAKKKEICWSFVNDVTHILFLFYFKRLCRSIFRALEAKLFTPPTQELEIIYGLRTLQIQYPYSFHWSKRIYFVVTINETGS